MIRAWLARRHPELVDETVVIGAHLDLADARIEGLRDALAEAQRRADEAERRAAVLEGRLARYDAAELMRRGLLEHMRRPARERERSTALEPTVVTGTEQLRRSRPAGTAAPTEQYRRTR